jgi:hypothetical protein
VGHPLASLGFASADGVYLSAGRIDALIVCRGQLLRSANPLRTRFGFAQVRRELGAGALSALHVVFAPDADRPLLLALVRLANTGDEPLALTYSETWEVSGSDYRAAAGACERHTADGMRALADVSFAVRASPPEPPPHDGLLLALRMLLPPHSLRELHFAYAAPGPGEPAAGLIRAWRGAVPGELARISARWRERLVGSADPLADYRNQVSRSS